MSEQSELDSDLDEATTLAMLAQLSSAEAEALARAIRCLGADSASDVVRDLRVAYAACVREHHAAGRSELGADLLCDLALQLVDPIRSLTTPCATFATTKLLFELLSLAGVELDEWTAVLWIRVLHPKSRVGAATALRSLVIDSHVRGGGGSRHGSIALGSPDELRRRAGVRRPRRDSANQGQGADRRSN